MAAATYFCPGIGNLPKGRTICISSQPCTRSRCRARQNIRLTQTYGSGSTFNRRRGGGGWICAWQGAFSPWILPPHPEPVLFPRKSLDMKFAVLLMRSAYEAVDALDFIPMDKFQVKPSSEHDRKIRISGCIYMSNFQFWKLRRDEVEPYSLQYRNFKIKYGDLTDPVWLYFDFISFAQFATISNEMRMGDMIFQEKLGVEGEVRTVRRDEQLKDNSALPPAFNRKAGDLIYERLLTGFEGEKFDSPPACTTTSSFALVVEDVRKLVQVFVDKGYALKGQVHEIRSAESNLSGKFRVMLEGTATLWGTQELASRSSSVYTHFDVLAVDAFLRASGRVARFSVEHLSTSSDSSWDVL